MVCTWCLASRLLDAVDLITSLKVLGVHSVGTPCWVTYAGGRHLHHQQMHHRQGQATLSVLPETLEGAEIAVASQLAGTAGTEPSPATASGRRHHRHHPPLLHSHHRAYLREQAAQLNDHMLRKSIVGFFTVSAAPMLHFTLVSLPRCM